LTKNWVTEHKYPQRLFSGSTLRTHMSTVLQNAREAISSLSYDYLAQTKHDDIVEALYNNNFIDIPYLKRGEATHSRFEFYLAPYLYPGEEKHKDTRQGSIFCVEVPFSGDRRYLTMRPAMSDNKPPAGTVEEHELYLFVAAGQALTPQQVQQKFNEMLDATDRFLEWQRATLKDFPMEFQRAAVDAIALRLWINCGFRRTRDIHSVADRSIAEMRDASKRNEFQMTALTRSKVLVGVVAPRRCPIFATPARPDTPIVMGGDG
jgi:hypothetical protein